MRRVQIIRFFERLRGTLSQIKPQRRLVFNLLVLLVPLALIPVIVVGAAGYLRSRALLINQITSQLEIYQSRQTNNISNWAREKNTRIGNLSRDNNFRNAMGTLLATPFGSITHQQAQMDVLTLLDSLNPSVTQTTFNQFLVTDTNGFVIAATVNAWEGIELGSTDMFSDQVTDVTLHSFFVINAQPLYNPEATPEELNFEGVAFGNRLYLFTMMPFIQEGNPTGYVIGISEPFAIQNILDPDLDFLPQSEIYFVHLDETNDQPDFSETVGYTRLRGIVSVPFSDGQIDLVDRGPYTRSTVASVYNTFDNDPVVGLYDTLPDLNIGIVVEVPQNTVFAQINELLPFTIYLVLGTVVLLVLVISFATRTVTNPIQQITIASQRFADGDWNERADIRRDDEIGQLAVAFNDMADQLANYYRTLEFQISEREQQLLTASQVGQLATTAENLDDVLGQTVNLLADRFDFYHVAVFLVDQAREWASFYEGTGPAGKRLRWEGFRIALTAPSLISEAVNANKYRLVEDVTLDSQYQPHELLGDTRAEIVIPIALGQEVLGVLDVQSSRLGQLTTSTGEILQVLANQLAAAVQNFQLKEGTEVDLQQVRNLYRASRRIAQAQSVEEIFEETANALLFTPWESALYVPRGEQLALIQASDGGKQIIEGEDLYDLDIDFNFPENIDVSAGMVRMFFEVDTPIIVRDMDRPTIPIRPELLETPRHMNFREVAYVPLIINDQLEGIMLLGTRRPNQLSLVALQPVVNFNELVRIALDKVRALQNTQAALSDLKILNEFSSSVTHELTSTELFPLLHEQIKGIFGEVSFFIALYDEETESIEIPYLFEEGEPQYIDPFPLGEGLTSTVIHSRQPLMLVENAEQRARELGAKVVGKPSKSWLGVPLITGGNVIGIMTVHDVENEGRFDENDLRLMTTLSGQIAGIIKNTVLLREEQKRAVQLQTTAEIARDISGTFELEALLSRAVNLIRDRFDFYHASVFLLDSSEEFAVVRESTGEAGRQMKAEEHRLAIGSKSIIGAVTETRQPLIVNDVTADPTHRFNPLLPDTRAELGIPMLVGERLIGALDVQSHRPYAFSNDDVEILRILADLLAVAVTNAELFSETQNHLAQHRLIHHVTTVAASSTSLLESLSSAVQGLRVTLGDRVSILLLDANAQMLQVQAAAGYNDDILGMNISVGEGITGWAAANREALLINDVLKDTRYIAGSESVRSEIAVPLVYRGELLGVLNVESDEVNAFDQHDQDILGTLAGSLGAIIVNARLIERQRQLFEVTTKIRRSANMESILETTAQELSRTLRTRRARVEVGGQETVATLPRVEPENGNTPGSGNGSADINNNRDGEGQSE